MAKKYYKVDRFLKPQYVSVDDERIDNTWIECDKNGIPLTVVPKSKANKDKGK